MKKVATIVVLVLMALSTLAAAQTRKMVRAEVPFEFITNGKTMPAALYTITATGNSLRIMSNKGFVLAMSNATWSSQPADATVLVFHRYGAHYFLSGIRCEGQDRGYELPPEKAEMEMRSKNATEGKIALIARLR